MTNRVVCHFLCLFCELSQNGLCRCYKSCNSSNTLALSLIHISSELRFVEQLIDSEQTQALAQILRFCMEKRLLERYTVAETVAYIQKETAKGGLTAVSGCSYAAMGLCMPRPQEIFACINRFRG